MKRPDVEKYEAMAGNATAGPWVYEWGAFIAGVNDGTHKDWQPPKDIRPGQCAYCRNPTLPFLLEYKDVHGRTYHIHVYKREPDDWHGVISMRDGTTICGNYDYEDGGVSSNKEDAAFIAASRTAVPELCAYIRELEGMLRARADERRGYNPPPTDATPPDKPPPPPPPKTADSTGMIGH